MITVTGILVYVGPETVWVYGIHDCGSDIASRWKHRFIVVLMCSCIGLAPGR